MTSFFRNTENDFHIWCRRYVPKALYIVDCYEHKGSIGLIIDEESYQEALMIKRQYTVLRAALNPAELDYLDRYLMTGLQSPYDRFYTVLYQEVYQVWQTICFPKHNYRYGKIDPILLGGQLKLYRLKKGLTLTKVAGLLNMAYKTIYAYETGTRMIRADTLYQLCQIYKVDIDLLLRKADISISKKTTRRSYNVKHNKRYRFSHPENDT